MIQIGKRYNSGTENARNEPVNVLYLRFVELVSFFAIVFIAKIIAKFNYRSAELLLVFLSAAFLQSTADWMWSWWGGVRGWRHEKIKWAILWYSSYVDLLVVIALIYFTGMIESPFLFMLVVPLFFVSNVFPRKITATCFLSVAMITIGTIGFLELKGAIPHNNIYTFDVRAFTTGHYLAGSLLVIGAFASLVLFLSNAFQDRFNVYVERLRRIGRESEHKYHELSRLYDISLGINSAISVETLLKIVAKEATLLLKRPWAAIVLFNSKQEIVESVFVGINQNNDLKLDRKVRIDGFSEWILAHKAPVFVTDMQKDKRGTNSALLTTYGIRSLVGFPLITGKQVRGIIYTGDFETNALDKDQVRLLTTLPRRLKKARFTKCSNVKSAPSKNRYKRSKNPTYSRRISLRTSPMSFAHR
jgi:hypothetical protein